MSKAETKPKKNKRNAVLYKEMTVDMKKPKIMIIMLLINLFVLPITLGFFLGISVAVFNNACSYRVLAWYLIAMVYTEFFILLFITPAITAGSISLEKERQTLDVLLTTRMTTWEIIKGKYASSVLFLGLMVLSTFPLLSLVFIYGGISLIQLFYIGLMMFVLIAFVSSFGVFFSTLTKNTIVSVILTYIVLLLFVGITFSMPFILLGIVKTVNDYLYYDSQTFQNIITPDFINGDILVMSGTLNPILMLFDTIGNTIGYDFSDLGSFKGMISLCGSEIMPHFTENNILVKLWTPISMIEMILITFFSLRISAYMLNPVKGKGDKRKNAQNTANKATVNAANSNKADGNPVNISQEDEGYPIGINPDAEEAPAVATATASPAVSETNTMASAGSNVESSAANAVTETAAAPAESAAVNSVTESAAVNTAEVNTVQESNQ